jgi:hypothetical protein
MYVAIYIRSNIAFAIERLSQYLVDLAKHHDRALKTLLKYFRSIVDKGLAFHSNESSQVVGYLNSNYAFNKLDRKLILKYAFVFASSLVLWMS